MLKTPISCVPLFAQALDELVDELTLLESKKAPEGWVAVWEDSVGQYYYINKTTGE